MNKAQQAVNLLTSKEIDESKVTDNKIDLISIEENFGKAFASIVSDIEDKIKEAKKNKDTTTADVLQNMLTKHVQKMKMGG